MPLHFYWSYLSKPFYNPDSPSYHCKQWKFRYKLCAQPLTWTNSSSKSWNLFIKCNKNISRILCWIQKKNPIQNQDFWTKTHFSEDKKEIHYCFHRRRRRDHGFSEKREKIHFSSKQITTASSEEEDVRVGAAFCF